MPDKFASVACEELGKPNISGHDEPDRLAELTGSQLSEVTLGA